nr:hypothetical protein [Tanacetum cinerariifolium]
MGLRPLPLSLMTGLRNLVDHLPPPGYWDFLYNRSVVEFLDLLNVNSTYYACMVFELSLRYEHEITIREKFMGKFTKSYNPELLGKVSGLESDCNSLKENVILLKSECESLRSQVEGETKLKELFMAMQDAEFYRLERRFGCLPFRALLLSIQQGLVASVEHGKAGRELSVVAAYDPGVKAKYEEAVRGIGEYFPFLLDRLESYKDAPLDRVMASFYLEGFPNVEDETLEFRRLWKPPMLVLGGIDRVYPRTWLLWKFFTSGPDDHSLVATVAPLNTLVDADYQISSLAIIDNIVSIAEPHDDMLDATVLDKPVNFKFF